MSSGDKAGPAFVRPLWRWGHLSWNRLVLRDFHSLQGTSGLPWTGPSGGESRAQRGSQNPESFET